MWAKVVNWIFGIDKEIREFKRIFPGKCLICFNHRMGNMHGYTSEIEQHFCIERKDQP